MKLYVNLEKPYEWVRVNGPKVEAYGEVPTLSDYPITETDELIGVVPGSFITTHSVTLPARNRKQFMAALPYALEEFVSEDVEDLYFVPINWRAAQETTVFVIARNKMSEWRDLANQHKLPLERLIPDYDLLPTHQVADYTAALNNDSLLVRSKDGSGLSVDVEFIEQWLMSLPNSKTIAVANQNLVDKLHHENPDKDFRHWDIGTRPAHWLELPNDSKLDFLGSEFRPKVRNISKRSFLLPLILFCSAIGLVLAFNTYRYFSMHAEIKKLDKEKRQIIAEKLPELVDVSKGNERYMMEQAVTRQSGVVQPVIFVELLAYASKILRQQNITLSEVSFRNSQMVINCNLKDLSQVDFLSRQFNQSSRIVARLESSTSEEGKVKASYILQAK